MYMRKIAIHPITVMLLSLFVFAACQKEGPAGADGPAGPQGPQGPSGPAGPAGTANVIYSDWLDVEFLPNDDSTSWAGEIAAAKLDAEILAKGEIKVYVNFGTADDPLVFPLPYFDGLFIINPVFVEGFIGVMGNVDAGTITEDGDTFFQYRYVLIPGSVLATKPDNVNLDNYEEAKLFLNLK